MPALTDPVVVSAITAAVMLVLGKALDMVVARFRPPAETHKTEAETAKTRTEADHLAIENYQQLFTLTQTLQTKIYALEDSDAANKREIGNMRQALSMATSRISDQDRRILDQGGEITRLQMTVTFQFQHIQKQNELLIKNRIEPLLFVLPDVDSEEVKKKTIPILLDDANAQAAA